MHHRINPPLHHQRNEFEGVILEIQQLTIIQRALHHMGGDVAQEMLRHTSKQIGASQQGLSEREIEHHGSFGMHAFT
ncbi:hypothetical protein PFLmoz3_04770 [Pseudomonas fluorescens]|uniref:Uncharacterized protein n=1 Tax=Pseudomonas fluorescens TaxID=294 RepID=A0A120G6D9_PSEFL|nr:hypothetical protein PFLmoz3_04770 [Pseudomonas fluorescens]